MMRKFFSNKLITLVTFVAFLALGAVSFRMVSALDSTSITVNGTSIYTQAGGYNSDHGIAGVSFDVPTMTLTLNNADIANISADDDLIIDLVGTNTVVSTSPDPAIRSVAGNVTIKGDESSLSISAFSADNTAIRIGEGKRLTIGDETSLNDIITVSILSGTNVNTDDTFIVGDNVYNYDGAPGPGGPGDPEGPPPGDPLQLSIDGTLVIDETAEPPVTSASGEGWSIEPGFMGSYGLNIDQGITLGYITGIGDGMLIITGDANIAENEDGFSINMNGRVNISGGESDVAGDINLAGGIFTQGMINTYDRAFTIGSAETPSSKGIMASEVEVHMGDLTIYTTGTALQYYDETPAEGDGMIVESGAGKTLTVASSDIATANVNSVRVSGGGTVDLSYTSSLGDFTPEASHWPWTDMTGTEEENPLPTTVTCEEGTDATNKYRMTSTEGNFLLESTAGTLYQLGWNIPGADDSIVTNGTVRVIAANGYRFTSGGYTDYSLEAGSTVTIELLPDYGYQYVSGGLNGNQTVPDEGKASYTFTMPNNHLHLSAIFERSSDIISVVSGKVSGASIAMPEGEINGNAEFSVTDSNNGDNSVFQPLASGSTIGGLVDLTLNEVVLKGSSDEAWKTNITELGQDMSVNLQLADSLKGHSNYSVLRDHDGTVTKLDSSYNETTGILSFDTDSYSTYAIAYSDTPSNPNTYDNIYVYAIAAFVALASLLVGLYYFRTRNKKLVL
ncbi:MAG: hypothetical protein BWY19_00402 [bacterium ADurb.Bin212]|nr:MAG: hypothetical protein BWY19_00402 [bacterium ADurb.Bin212]